MQRTRSRRPWRSIDAYAEMDLTAEPPVAFVPALSEPRWYIVQIGDSFDEIVRNIGGTRGAQPGVYVITVPDFRGAVPGDMVGIRRRTKIGVAAVRILANGSADLPKAVEAQKGSALRLGLQSAGRTSADGVLRRERSREYPFLRRAGLRTSSRRRFSMKMFGRFLGSTRSPHSSHLAPHGPGCTRDGKPGQRGADERSDDTPLDQQPEHDREGQHTDRTQRGTRRLERGGSLSAAPAVEAHFSFAADFMLLDEGRAGAEDSWKSEKETADRGAAAAADHAREDRGGTTQREADDVFVPAPLAQ